MLRHWWRCLFGHAILCPALNSNSIPAFFCTSSPFHSQAVIYTTFTFPFRIDSDDAQKAMAACTEMGDDIARLSDALEAEREKATGLLFQLGEAEAQVERELQLRQEWQDLERITRYVRWW